jgi:cytochrome c oxidase subunit 2
VARLWSLLFALAPILTVAMFIAGPIWGIWLPRDVSAHGGAVDHLFYLILWITGAVFVGTEGVLFWFMWRYEDSAHRAPARFVHGSHALEVIWTIVPAGVLLFMAFYQLSAWAEAKMDQPAILPTVEVSARQFEWRLRYPGRDGKLGTRDDLFLVNDLHLPAGEEVLVELKSMDVLHSFFLPNLRVKQDAVPGMTIPVWFKPSEPGQYDLICAELCGWGHYKMKGRLTIEPRADFERWLEQKTREQEVSQEPSAGAGETRGGP